MSEPEIVEIRTSVSFRADDVASTLYVQTRKDAAEKGTPWACRVFTDDTPRGTLLATFPARTPNQALTTHAKVIENVNAWLKDTNQHKEK